MPKISNKHAVNLITDAIAFEYSKPNPNLKKIASLSEEGGKYLKRLRR